MKFIPELERFCKSFFPNSIKCWNNLDPAIRNVPSLSLFKKRLLDIIRPPKKEIFGLTDRQGLKWIFQLRVGLSPLKSHKLKHNFSDTINDTCSCNLSSETTHHFFIACPNYNLICQNLFSQITSIFNTKLPHLLFYGHESLEFSENSWVYC